MASLQQRARHMGLALALALGLTILSGVVTPMLSDELASVLPGVDVVLADEPAGGGGG